MNDKAKPPIGIIPEHLWEEARLSDLARAIHEHIALGYTRGHDADTVSLWCDELSRKLQERVR